MRTWRIVEPGEAPEPWEGDREYKPGSRAIHRRKLWEAGDLGIWDPSIEPGESQWWKEVEDFTGCPTVDYWHGED